MHRPEALPRSYSAHRRSPSANDGGGGGVGAGEGRPYSSPAWAPQQYRQQQHPQQQQQQQHRPALHTSMSDREASWHARTADAATRHDEPRSGSAGAGAAAYSEEQRHQHHHHQQYVEREREEYMLREREREASGGSLPRALMHPDWLAGRGRFAASGTGTGSNEHPSIPPPLRALHERTLAAPTLPAASSPSAAAFEERYRGARLPPLTATLPRQEQQQDFQQRSATTRSLVPPPPTLPPPDSRYMAGYAHQAPRDLPRSPPQPQQQSRQQHVQREASYMPERHEAPPQQRSAAYAESTRRLLDAGAAPQAPPYYPERPYSAHGAGAVSATTENAHYRPHHLDSRRLSPPTHGSSSAATPSSQTSSAETRMRTYSVSTADERHVSSSVSSPEAPGTGSVASRGAARVYHDARLGPALPRAYHHDDDRSLSSPRRLLAMGPPLVLPPTSSGDKSPPGTDALGALDASPSSPNAAKRLAGRALTAAEKRKGSSTESQTRRLAHLVSEQRRRFSINAGFEELRAAVPTCSEGGESKATILRRAIEYIASLEDLVRRPNTGGSGSGSGGSGSVGESNGRVKGWTASQAGAAAAGAGGNPSASPSAYSGSPVGSPASNAGGGGGRAWQGAQPATANGTGNGAEYARVEQANNPHPNSGGGGAYNDTHGPTGSANEEGEANARSSPTTNNAAASRKRRASGAADLPRPAPGSFMRQHEAQSIVAAD